MPSLFIFPVPFYAVFFCFSLILWVLWTFHINSYVRRTLLVHPGLDAMHLHGRPQNHKSQGWNGHLHSCNLWKMTSLSIWNILRIGYTLPVLHLNAFGGQRVSASFEISTTYAITYRPLVVCRHRASVHLEEDSQDTKTKIKNVHATEISQLRKKQLSYAQHCSLNYN